MFYGQNGCWGVYDKTAHEENFMAIFTTLGMVISYGNSWWHQKSYECLDKNCSKIKSVSGYFPVTTVIFIPMSIKIIFVLNTQTALKYLYCTRREFYGNLTTLSMVIWFSTSTLGILATLVYVFTMLVVINDILSMTIIPTLSTFILFCNLCYILLWISPRSVVKIAIRM